jgi:F-type H+-transporting ATPase subunit alpha
MPVEDQVVQIYAATGGYLDRISIDRVRRFLADLTDSVRGNEPKLLKKIAGGDWSDETQEAVDDVVKRFAEDFGYDLDEEGHPLQESDEPVRRESEAPAEASEEPEAEPDQEEAVAPA